MSEHVDMDFVIEDGELRLFARLDRAVTDHFVAWRAQIGRAAAADGAGQMPQIEFHLGFSPFGDEFVIKIDGASFVALDELTPAMKGTSSG